LFKDNEHVIRQLITSYYQLERFEDVIILSEQIKKSENFLKSKTNLYYAESLDKTGKTDQAEKEYDGMNNRFSNYEARYKYGNFLLKNNSKAKAAEVFKTVASEAENLSSRERNEAKIWLNKTRDE